MQPSNLWEIPVIFFCLSLLTLIPRTAKDRAIKSLIFHVLLFASFVCLAESQTHSYIVELEQNADLPSQNFSIKPEPDTLPAMQMIDMGSLQGKPTEMTNISGYSGSDTPPDDKPYWPRSFWESLTTVVESVTWQLLYASNEVIGYKLLLAFQKDSYQPQPFSWMPVVATVVVGWLTRSNWNPEAPLFNQLDEQESNKQHELQIITLMNNPSGGHTWSTGTWGQGQSFTTHSFTSSSHYSFVNHQNGYNEDDPGRPNFPCHSYGENCHEHPCYTRRGHCIYAPPIQHLAEYWYEDCLAVSYIPELATHQAQTPPPVITRCHLNPDASTTCSASVHPYTSGGHTWSTGTWGQGQSFTTHSFTSSSHYSFVNHQNGYNEDDPGRPNSPRHSYGENCHEHPCYTRRGHCIYAPPIQHLTECWCEDCLAVSYIPELATHQAQTPPPVITRCHLNPDASTTCSASVHPYTSYPESSVAEADSASSQSLAESGATAHAAAVGADTTAPLASGQAGHLRRHIATVHKKKKDHICQHQGDDGQPCGRAFGLAGDLRRHIATVHEKKKDHICQHQGDDGQPCGRAFGRAGHLRRHTATVHEKKKDHICQHQDDDGQPCGRAFGLAGNLRRHIATVHEKKKDHICQHQGDDGQPCGRAFGLAGDLRRHIATVHEKKKDHICQHQGDDGQPCGRAFGLAGNLRTHIATVHEKGREGAPAPKRQRMDDEQPEDQP